MDSDSDVPEFVSMKKAKDNLKDMVIKQKVIKK